MRKPLVAAILAATMLSTMPGVGSGDGDTFDYDIPNGHFYTQTNGSTSGSSPTGFAVTNDLGVPFWSEFQQLGGVDRLGYPVSRRFVWKGLVVQVMQKAVLQWSPENRVVQVVNVIDDLAEAGFDGWLAANWQVPLPSAELMVEVADRWAISSWLSTQPNIEPVRRFYALASDPLKLYGLPSSPPTDLGDLVAIRFQRTVLQLWKVVAPGVAPGVVTALNVGEVLKASGQLPAEALLVEDAPPAIVRAEALGQRTVSRNETETARGVATWYGAYFQGSPMRNGDPYDMHNPRTAAANVFPLGSWLRVVNVRNGSSVIVEVTDTGAFRYPIVVDLSWAAFRKIADPDDGVVAVQVQPLRRE